MKQGEYVGMKGFAEFLKQYIENSGLSYRKAADMCGIDRTLLGRYANGQRTPSGDAVIDKIATGLGMSEDDKKHMHALLKNKNDKKTQMFNVYIDRICNESFKYRMYNIKLNDNIINVDENGLIKLTCWEEILRYTMYVVNGSDKISMRIDPEYKNIFRRFDFGKDDFSKIDVTCIVRLHGSNYSDELENIRYFYALYPILCELKSCNVYHYYRNMSEADESEINFVISEKGIVIFDKTLNNGMFTNKATYMEYYQRIFDMLKEKCELYVKTENGNNGEQKIVYDEKENLVIFRQKDKNDIHIAEPGLIRQFVEYINKR